MVVDRAALRSNSYIGLMGARLRSLTGSPWLLAMRAAGDILIVSAEAAGPALLAYRFGSIAGWSAAQVVMLVGLGRAGEGLALVFGRGVDPTVFSETVRMGRFDQVLTRPISPLGWLLTTEVELRFLGRALAGAAIAAIAAGAAHVVFSPFNVGLLVLAVLSAAVIVLAILVMGCALTFVTIEGSDIANLFSNGGISLASYPLDLYGSALRFTFTFLIPVGLCIYLPVLTVLGRHGPAPLRPQLLFLLPVALAAFVGLAALAWRAGLRHYQSTGS